MPSTVIVRYGELALKSEPVRRRFERSLINSMKRILRGLNYVIRAERGRIFVDAKSTATIVKRLAKVPGITSLSPSSRTRAALVDIRSRTTGIAKKALRPGMSFAVRTNRVGEHDFSSRDVNVDIGSAVLSVVNGLRVDLTNPDVEISIDIRGKDAYIYTEVIEGVGGLPIGTQGKVVAIFSGTGNDVAAAFMMLKRGCRVFPLFLNPAGGLKDRMSRRAISSAKKLAQFHPDLELFSFPFKKAAAEINKKSAERVAFYLCRRAALRAAEIVARRVGAEAIVVGDDAKLIKEQKLANLSVIDEACKLAVLRPLVAIGAGEVDRVAKKVDVKSSAASPLCPAPSGESISLEEIKSLEIKIKVNTIIDDTSKKIETMRFG